ncbi:MAG TPA: TauD/TfdA family dioxygenase [Blastocatellia bacterium]|nr:TauD/TfdA family dioxygenase [Blastocatellia bacterium]
MNAASLSPQRITASDLKPIGGLPMLLDVEASGLNAVNWAEEYQQDIQSWIKTNGAILIRGLKVPGSTQFGKILSTLFGAELLEYTYRSTPRTKLRGNVYTATEYPESEVIPQHNENAYSRNWPNRIGFLCLLPAETGGETPIGDSRVVYNMLPKSVRDKFEQRGVMYVRNYSTLDLSWSVVFQTEDKSQVEDYCNANELTYEWLENDGLRTRQVNPATAVHPDTGEKVWFNQAHLFHVSNLGKEVADTLLTSLGEESLPRNAYYGDGAPIEVEALELIRSIYEQTKIKFAWQKNDLLLLDNMLFTHGRESYIGARKVLVGMACPNR